MKLKVPAFFFISIFPLFAQYAGPAILSRGEAPSAMSFPKIKFRPYLSAGLTYSTALAGVAVNDEGQLADRSSAGATLSWGVSGAHGWRRTNLGLSYRGGWSRYLHSNADTLSQSLLLGLSRQLARHVTLSVSTSAGVVSRDFGLLGLEQTVPFDPMTTSIPVTDFFDNRTYHFGTQASLSIRKSARLSFGISGGVGYTWRRSRALSGNRSEHGGADVQYRVSMRSTIGAMYSYGHYKFPRTYGRSTVQSIAATYARQLSRFVEFSGYAGIMRPETEFLQTVQIDPVIVALLGISSGTRIAHQAFITPHLGARISKAFERGVAYASIGRGMTPGNGLFLTSVSTSALAGYSYSGLRRWSLRVSTGRFWASSIGTIGGRYTTSYLSGAVSRTLRHGLHFSANYSMRWHGSPDFERYNRAAQSMGVSLSWSPGEVPLRLW